MTLFLFSLAGIPPVGGWYAKFEIFRVLTDGGSGAGVSLAIIAAVNSVFAAFYYLAILKQMWFMPAPDGDHSRISIPPSLQAALGVTVFVTIVTGSVLIGPLSDITKLADLALP
jgi:NADH-quinone oxidoreductase subunit N